MVRQVRRGQRKMAKFYPKPTGDDLPVDEELMKTAMPTVIGRRVNTSVKTRKREWRPTIVQHTPVLIPDRSHLPLWYRFQWWILSLLSIKIPESLSVHPDSGRQLTYKPYKQELSTSDGRDRPILISAMYGRRDLEKYLRRIV